MHTGRERNATEETLTRGLCGCSAVTRLGLQWGHDDGAGAGAIAPPSAGPLWGGPAVTPESTQGVCGIGAAQGRVRVWRVVDSDIADDIRPCLQARAEKEMQENSTPCQHCFYDGLLSSPGNSDDNYHNNSNNNNSRRKLLSAPYASGTILTLYTQFPESSEHFCEVGTVILVLQTRQLRPGRTKKLGQGHASSKTGFRPRSQRLQHHSMPPPRHTHPQLFQQNPPNTRSSLPRQTNKRLLIRSDQTSHPTYLSSFTN